MSRPSVMTPKIIALLKEAFLNGASDKEACAWADISPSTLYLYCQENPSFSEQKEQLKEMVKYKAKTNIVEAINNGDRSMSQWYLERRAKDEFSQRNEMTGADGKDLPTPILSHVFDKKDEITGNT